MKPIAIPTTKEEMLAVAREFDAAHWFIEGCEEEREIKRAIARIEECERAMDAAPFTIDEDGNVTAKEPTTDAGGEG